MSYEHTFIYKNGTTKTKNLSPIKAIREKCLECSCWMIDEVKGCPAMDCVLFPFRFGKDPGRKKKEMSEENKARLSEQLKKGREAYIKNG